MRCKSRVKLCEERESLSCATHRLYREAFAWPMPDDLVEIYNRVFVMVFGFKPKTTTLATKKVITTFRKLESFFQTYPRICKALWMRAQMSGVCLKGGRTFQVNMLIGGAAEDRYNKFISNARKEGQVTFASMLNQTSVGTVYRHFCEEEYRMGMGFVQSSDDCFGTYASSNYESSLWLGASLPNTGDGVLFADDVKAVIPDTVLGLVSASMRAEGMFRVLCSLRHDFPDYVEYAGLTWEGIREAYQAQPAIKKKSRLPFLWGATYYG